MAFDADAILDRRRLRKKLTFWRVATFAIAVIAIIAAIGSVAGTQVDVFDKQSPHIARVPIEGFIGGARYGFKQLEKIRDDENVAGVVLAINSPGGATTGGELTYKLIREIAEKKPVIATVDGLAASAAYMIAIGADRIIAPNNSLIGSVGVIFQYPDATTLMGNIGVSMEEIKSSPLKAEPSPFNETPQEAIDNIQKSVDDSYNWFADLVKERRSLNDQVAEVVLDGTIYTGRQALGLKLIDGIGHEQTAIDWLKQEKKLDENLKLVSWSLEKPREDYLFGSQILAHIAEKMGLSEILPFLQRFDAPQHDQRLDGLLSVWQGPRG